MVKKAIEIKKDEKEPVKEESKSKRYEAFKALIKAYKKQNPAKYEAKKEVLKERLKNIK